MPSVHPNEDWIGLQEAERFSGLSRATLRRLIRNGEIRATKIGGTMMIDKHSLEEYMRDHGYAEQLRLFD